jgi:hypothetical protein
MSSSPGPSSGSWRWLRKINEHPVIVSITALVPVLGLLVAIAAYRNDVDIASRADDASGSSLSPRGPADTAPETSATRVEPPALSAGQCFDGSMQLGSCDLAHALEIVSLGGGCDIDDLLAYLGGVDGQDVLLSSVVPELVPLPAGDACTVRPPGSSNTHSARDALLGPEDDAWRRCEDVIGREVPCSEAHLAEVVLDGVPPGGSLDCSATAATYLDAPFARHSDDLSLVQRGEQCLVSARGNNELTGSVRRLGSRALPLVPSD